MRVAFDARHLQTASRVRGIGRYSRNLLIAFARQAPTDIDWTLLRLRGFPAPAAMPLPSHRELWTRRLVRPELSMLLFDPLALSLELRAVRPDVFHSVQLGLPQLRSFPVVVTVHDLTPLRWPEHYLRLPHSRLGHRWQYALAKRADAVIAPSDATRADLVDRLRVPPERVHVIPEAVDHDFAPPPRDAAVALVRARFGIPARYVLYVGQFDPRKNMDALLVAFSRAAKRDAELRLVVAGDLGKLARFLYEALDRSRVARDRVVLAGHVDDALLGALYAGAECLVHPALLEGFGLTPLESLSAGTPVVALRDGAVAEVVGDAGLLTDDGQALGDALVRVLEDDALARDLRARAKPRAALFSWDRAAADTIALYRSVAR